MGFEGCGTPGCPYNVRIGVETFFQGRKRAAVAQLLGISVRADDNHLRAAIHSLRELFTQDADVFTDVDCSLWHDRIEDLRERYAAVRQLRASGKKSERSNFGGNRSNFEGDRGKNSRAGAA